jgi:membrane protein
MAGIFHLRWKDLGGLLRESAGAWSDDNVPRLGAALAFYALLSLAPLIVIVVAVAAQVFGRKAAEGQLAWEMQRMWGFEQARAVQELISGAFQPAGHVIGAWFSVITLAVGATGVVVELQDALNTIWHVPSQTGLASIASLIKQRVVSFLMVLAVGFLLLMSLILGAWMTAMGKVLDSMFPIHESNLHVVTLVTSFVVITFLFAAIYKIMPDVPLQWRDVWAGAAFTSLTFTIGKQLLALYLGGAGIGSSYGAAGSLVVVLVWVYYSAQIFFFGAEFTKVYARKFGSHFSAKLQPAGPKPSLV